MIGKFRRILCFFCKISLTPTKTTGPIINKLNKKYGLINPSSKITAIKTIDAVIKICLTLIFVNSGRLRAFSFYPNFKSRNYPDIFKESKHSSNRVFPRLFYESLSS